MKAYVAVTDKKWFEHLRALSHRGRVTRGIALVLASMRERMHRVSPLQAIALAVGLLVGCSESGIRTSAIWQVVK